MTFQDLLRDGWAGLIRNLECMYKYVAEHATYGMVPGLSLETVPSHVK